MKLSEVRPCDNCGGKIAPVFYVVRFSIAAFNVLETNRALGLTQYFGGSIALGEMFTDTNVMEVAMDEKEFHDAVVELFLCTSCQATPVNLTELAEKRCSALASKVSP